MGGKNSIFTAHTCLRKGPVRLRKIDYAEKEGYVKGVVKAIVHESGRGAPIAKVQFQNAYRYQRDTELFVVAQGARRGHESRGAPARRRQPPAHRPPVDDARDDVAGKKVGLIAAR